MNTLTLDLNVNFKGNVDFVSILDHMSIPGALDGPVGQVLVHPQPAVGTPQMISVHPEEFLVTSVINSCTLVSHFEDSFG